MMKQLGDYYAYHCSAAEHRPEGACALGALSSPTSAGLRIAVGVLPATLMATFVGIIGLLALFLDEEDRRYALDIADCCADLAAILVSAPRHARGPARSVARHGLEGPIPGICGGAGVMRTGQVFVSHPSDMAQFPEGRSFVQAVLDAVGRAGMAPVDMRFFAAGADPPAAYCRQRVRQCEVYIAVIGFRYGTIVPGEAVSYTELEFGEATTAGLPRLVFLLGDTDGVPAMLADADRGPAERFRQRLRDAGLLVREFSSAADLELEVFHALRNLADGPQLAVLPEQGPRGVAPHMAGRTTPPLRRPTGGRLPARRHLRRG